MVDLTQRLERASKERSPVASVRYDVVNDPAFDNLAFLLTEHTQGVLRTMLSCNAPPLAVGVPLAPVV